MSPMVYSALQIITRGRENGVSVVDLGQQSKYDQKTCFYLVRQLTELDLVYDFVPIVYSMLTLVSSASKYGEGELAAIFVYTSTSSTGVNFGNPYGTKKRVQQQEMPSRPHTTPRARHRRFPKKRTRPRNSRV